ncbi:MAG: hypothetical protein ACI9MC_000456 [Kiritimatiellia bacterium]|jgi:hypothetical protein
MPPYKLEYLWPDGYKPVAHLRSKTTDEFHEEML